ncbi:MAG: hypothetical protein ACOYLE_08290 [Bacteroidales bacterium]
MNIFRNTFIFVFSIVAVLITIECKAQFSFSPSTTLSVSLRSNLMKYDSIHISNNSNDTLYLNWNLLQYDSIGGTYIDFCSSGYCWSGVPVSGIFPPIPPGGFGWAGVHFWTGNHQGNCTAKIYVYQQNHPENGDTLTYFLQTINDNSIEDNYESQVYVFPNPVFDKLFIKTETENMNIFTIKLFNLKGGIIDKSNAFFNH